MFSLRNCPLEVQTGYISFSSVMKELHEHLLVGTQYLFTMAPYFSTHFYGCMIWRK